MKARPGFMLAEMLIAIILASMLMIGLFSIFTSTFNFQRQGTDKDKTQSGELLALRTLADNLPATTYVSVPGDPSGGTTASDILSGCTNYDPSLVGLNGGDGRYNPNLPVKAFEFCLDHKPAGQQDIWFTWVTKNVKPFSACGGGYLCNNASGARTMPGFKPHQTTILAVPVYHDTANGCLNIFYRPGGSGGCGGGSGIIRNVVNVHFVVATSSLSAVTVDTALNFLGGS